VSYNDGMKASKTHTGYKFAALSSVGFLLPSLSAWRVCIITECSYNLQTNVTKIELLCYNSGD
jgi:hypothetical protein